MKGALCSVFLLGIFGGDPMHLHSWGSLFVQEMLLPYRKEPLRESASHDGRGARPAVAFEEPATKP